MLPSNNRESLPSDQHLSNCRMTERHANRPGHIYRKGHASLPEGVLHSTITFESSLKSIGFDMIHSLMTARQTQGRTRRNRMQGIAVLAFAALTGTGALAQTESLRPFVEAVPLEGASQVVLERMGFELGYGPEGFVLGGYNLLNPNMQDRFDSGRVLPRLDIQPMTGPLLKCTDMACIEGAFEGEVDFMMPGGSPLPPEAQDREMFLISLAWSDIHEIRHEAARQIVYATTGILYPQDRTSETIEAVEPGSPAFVAGLRAGHRLTRLGDNYADAGALARAARTGAPITLYWRADPNSQRETQGGLVPRSGDLTVVDGIIGFGADAPSQDGLPSPFRLLTEEKGLMALAQGKPELSPEQERRVAALRILEGWSANSTARDCLIQPLVQIDIRTSITATETNLFGQTRTSLDVSSVDPLFVEKRFEPFVRSMSHSWSSPETVGAIEIAAARLVQLEGCNGANVQKLIAEIAALAGITVPVTEVITPAPSGFQPDWRSFLAQCYPNQMQATRMDGRNVPERGAVALCVCVEYGAAEHGDPGLYARYRAWSFDGIPQETLDAIWAQTQNGACSRSGNPQDPVLVERYETFLRANGL